MGHRDVAAMTMADALHQEQPFMIGFVLAYDPSRGSSRRGPAGGET